MAVNYKPKVYIEVEGGTLAEVMDWFISADCPYNVRDIDYPNGVVESVHDTVEVQAREIEHLLDRTDKLESALEAETSRAEHAEHEVEELLSPSSRRPPPHFKLPDERPSVVHAFHIGLADLGKGYIIAGHYPNTTEVGEIFIKMAVMSPDPTHHQGDKPPDVDDLLKQMDALKQQVSDLTWFLKGILDQLAIAVSIGLQRGIPLEVYVRKFQHTKFPPDGMTRNKDIPRCSSIVDYLFRWLAHRFIGEVV